jgi:hypothetical protein
MRSRIILLVALTASLAIALVALASSLALPSSKHNFEFIILKQTWSTLHLGYGIDNRSHAQEAIRTATLDEGNVFFRLQAPEIETYHWDTRTFTLSDAASRHLEERFKTQYKFYQTAFAVRVDGTFIYGGIFLDEISQMAIQFPVARANMVNDRLTISLLPVHMAFIDVDPISGSGQMSEDPVSEAFKAEIPAEMFADVAKTTAQNDAAVYFRALLEDVRIKNVLREAGKLKE